MRYRLSLPEQKASPQLPTLFPRDDPQYHPSRRVAAPKPSSVPSARSIAWRTMRRAPDLRQRSEPPFPPGPCSHGPVLFGGWSLTRVERACGFLLLALERQSHPFYLAQLTHRGRVGRRRSRGSCWVVGDQTLLGACTLEQFKILILLNIIHIKRRVRFNPTKYSAIGEARYPS